MHSIKAIATVIFFFLLGVQLFAQHHNQREMSAEQKAEKRTSNMTETLELTEDQRKEVYQINLTAAEELKALDNEKLTADERRRKKKQVAMDTRKKLSSVLTDEQMEKMKSAMKERRHEKKRR